jgi:hypothetical protein
MIGAAQLDGSLFMIPYPEGRRYELTQKLLAGRDVGAWLVAIS